ncbi:MAG: DEAD/DEAH box helicase family protein, partial [Erysipelotrichaceae bacterium]|nr:DEAD/DEAH box helicase family protein [Erysipelotrichaceae bacterium]
MNTSNNYIDNVNYTLKEDLQQTIKKDAKISIAAAAFSMYAFNELKKQLKGIDEFNFIFTDPLIQKEKTKKERREFYIPQPSIESQLTGTEFEIKLKNELTQKAVAKECADWIRKKATFKANKTGLRMSPFYVVDNQDEVNAYSDIQGFTTVDLGTERGNSAFMLVNRFEAPHANRYLQVFNNIWNDKNMLEDVTDQIIQNLSNAYAENPPELIYFMILYNVFSEFLEDISEDIMPNEATGFKQSKIWNLLYDFQKDAALGLIQKLEKYNGCILADSVGLGKTFTALSVIKYYENRNKNVLVLCPKKLEENWNTYKGNYVNNPIAEDRLRYDVLFHTDLSRNSGKSNGIDLERINWGNYDLVVIDESHAFRTGIGTHSKTKENRYTSLMNKVMKDGVKTNQLALAYEGNSEEFDSKLKTTKPIDEIFRQAQTAFNNWSKLEQKDRTTEALLQSLDFDFFEILDAVTIARSRKHIQQYYNSAEIGKFPDRLKPISLRPGLTNMSEAITYNEIYDQLNLLNLEIYTPSNFIFPSRMEKYVDEDHPDGLTMKGRELGIRKLMSINLLKRLESSVHSFDLTLERIYKQICQTIQKIEDFQSNRSSSIEVDGIIAGDFDIEDSNDDLFTVGKKVKIDLKDMDVLSWKQQLKADQEVLELLISMVKDITAEQDEKLSVLKELIENKISNPINPGNKKILIFSAFADTAEYLYDNLAPFLKERYGINTGLVTGSTEGKTTIKGLKPNLNNVLTCFSPISKGRDSLMPGSKNEIDLLIATDCISEGQNLQDCDYLVNYDIHWNPVRIIQRFGRIDRIGSKNEVIQLVNFWPDLTLDDYINLKSRVETRMKVSIMTSTGDDDLINDEEKGDLEYRKAQLEKLQNEVVDLEDMNDGISIMDLGLEEYRQDLLKYVKDHPEIEKLPHGLHCVVPATNELPKGYIFILKNINSDVNIDHKNQIHPFYMVYIDEDGNVICNH